MKKWFAKIASALFCTLVLALPAHAGTPMTERIAIEAGVKAEIMKDLAVPYNPLEGLSGTGQPHLNCW